MPSGPPVRSLLAAFATDVAPALWPTNQTGAGPWVRRNARLCPTSSNRCEAAQAAVCCGRAFGTA